jgi:CHAT domain-containing protein
MAHALVIAWVGWMAQTHAAEAGGKASETAIHAAVHDDIAIRTVKEWVCTGIQVPGGALVAVTARGEVRNVQGRPFRCRPHQCLRCRVGESGPPRGFSMFHTDEPVAVIRSPVDGALWCAMGPGFQRIDNKRGEMTVTAVVWAKEAAARAEEELEGPLRQRLGQGRYEALRLALAQSLMHGGEYSRAESLLARIRESQDGGSKQRAIALIQSAIVGIWLRRYERASALAEEAVGIARREGYRALEAEALVRLGEALSHLGQKPRAMELVKEALTLVPDDFKGPGVHRLRGQARQILGLLLWQRNRNDEALVQFRHAVEDFRKGGNWMPMAQTLFLLGRSQDRARMPEEARRSLSRALRMATALGRRETVWRAHGHLGWMAERDGDIRGAFDHYAESIRVIESMRGELDDAGTRVAFMENKLEVYERMIRLLQRLKRDPEAFHYLERSKARLMLDMLQEKAFSSKRPEENELLRQERALRRQIDQAGGSGEEPWETEAGEEGEEASGEPGEPRGGGASQAERLRGEHAAVLQRIEQSNPELASLLTINPLRAHEVQAMLEPDMALLAYYVGWGLATVFVVTRDAVTSVPLELSRKEIAEQIARFREEAVEVISVEKLTSQGYRRPLAALYAALVRPVEERIAEKRRLVIVPHGVLHYLPFPALLRGDAPGERYLLESHTISFLPSASVLPFVKAKSGKPRQGVLAVGNPTTDLAPLPAAEAEAREVSTLFQRRLLLTGDRATETSVKREGPRHDMILLSTHGEMLEAEPLKSNLRFAPSPSDDGRLTVSEIFDLEVRADLVTLSACETGLARGAGGGFPSGDDLVGLSRAFIHAGAPSVVASLWKVSDDSTVSLMQAFHRRLREMPKAEALRQAQMELMRTRPDLGHPFFWAPFVLVGYWN